MTVTSWTDDDEQLWRELRTAVHERDAVDPRHVDAARAALVAHRRRRAPEVVRCRGVRCRPGSRKRHCGRTVLPVPRGHDLHRAGAADGHAVGQVLPVRACRLVKGSVDGEVAEIDVDDTGFFRFPVSDREKFRLHLEADGQAHVTQWVTV